MDRLTELRDLYEKLLNYHKYLGRHIYKQNLNEKDKELTAELLSDLGRKVGYMGKLITELTGLANVDVYGKEYDMWVIALQIPAGELELSALGYCIQVTNRAIGQFEEDVKNGKRDTNTGELITKKGETIENLTKIPPKAFIAHEGETRALSMLKEFLEALDIKYFIAELKASAGRSIEKQVDWTQSNADFAICLATKGKAINKRTGKHYMGLNVADELGRARQVFGSKIILLLQKGVEPHTNIREIVYENFTTTNMEKAFIKIAKELKNWGFIITGIKKES